MKRCYILIVFVFLFQSTLSAQSYKVTYERVSIVDLGKFSILVNLGLGDKKEHKNITTHYLLHKNGLSNYFGDRKLREVKEGDIFPLSNNKDRTIKSVRMSKSKKLSILYKDLAHKSYLNNSGDLGKPVLIKDKLPTYKWKISKEVKVIGSFVCMKATAMQDKEEITAWYTAAVPIKDGPYKYYGLPGLIIELKHKNKTFRAISVEKKQDVKIIVPHEKKVMNQAEYDKKFEDAKHSFMIKFGE